MYVDLRNCLIYEINALYIYLTFCPFYDLDNFIYDV